MWQGLAVELDRYLELPGEPLLHRLWKEAMEEQLERQLDFLGRTEFQLGDDLGWSLNEELFPGGWLDGARLWRDVAPSSQPRMFAHGQISGMWQEPR